jgi:ATP-dependent Clp protease ATP-binding subunit ClpX
LADRTSDVDGREVRLCCLVCRKSQVGDSGGETRYSGGRTVYVCSSCLPSWKASELWNASNQSVGRHIPNPVAPHQVVPEPARQSVVTQRGDRQPRFELTAPEIRSQLDRWIVGQESAKLALSTIVHRHYMRVRHRLSGDDVLASQIPRENVLIVGPTGSGKTELVKRASSIMSVPRVIVSATSFTEEGYYGSSVNDVFHMLKVATGSDGTERFGIVCWDEIDKKAKRDTGQRRDVSGLGVQQALLEQLDTDGRVIDITGNRQGDREQIDTTDMMFLLAGAFSDGLDEIVERRRSGGSRIGFGAGVRESVDPRDVTDEDIENYGFIPEFCSRIDHVVVLDPLTAEQMRSILFDVENAPIEVHRRLATQHGFDLKFDESAVELIVDRSMRSNMGARKLKAMVSRATLQIFYDMPSKVGKRRTVPRVTVTAETILDPSKYRVR